MMLFLHMRADANWAGDLVRMLWPFFHHELVGFSQAQM
jgi:hypothetical protein